MNGSKIEKSIEKDILNQLFINYLISSSIEIDTTTIDTPFEII